MVQSHQEVPVALGVPKEIAVTNMIIAIWAAAYKYRE